MFVVKCKNRDENDNDLLRMIGKLYFRVTRSYMPKVCATLAPTVLSNSMNILNEITLNTDGDKDIEEDMIDEDEFKQWWLGHKELRTALFGKLQARAVLRDVGRVLNMPFGQVDRICKLVPNNPANPVTLAEALETEPGGLETVGRQRRTVTDATLVGVGRLHNLASGITIGFELAWATARLELLGHVGTQQQRLLWC